MTEQSFHVLIVISTLDNMSFPELEEDVAEGLVPIVVYILQCLYSTLTSNHCSHANALPANLRQSGQHF